MRWLGVKADDDQALAWPRQYVVNPESRFARGGLGTLIDATVIPQKIKDAQCELAMAYLEGFDEGQEDAIDSFSADGVSVKFREAKPASALPVRFLDLIKGLTFKGDLIRA